MYPAFGGTAQIAEYVRSLCSREQAVGPPWPAFSAIQPAFSDAASSAVAVFLGHRVTSVVCASGMAPQCQSEHSALVGERHAGYGYACPRTFRTSS